MSYTQYNKKTLALAYGWSYKVLRKKMNALMHDEEFRTKFGSYSDPFTPKQLELIQEELGLIPFKT